MSPVFHSPHAAISLLTDLISLRGYLQTIRVDNGTEFSSHVFKDWASTYGIKIVYIQPGKPAQNGFVERFNRTYREDVLDMYLFDTLKEVKQITDEWVRQYNQLRPHESLGNLSPILFNKMRKPTYFTILQISYFYLSPNFGSFTGFRFF